MTINEMSDAFDTLTNVFLTNYGFGQNDKIAFNEYEKSYFLTLALNAFVTSCYNGKNLSGYLFEVTEEDRRILDSLVKTEEKTDEYSGDIKKISQYSHLYQIPEDVMFLTYELVVFSGNNCINGKYAIVQPVTLDDFWKTYKNPFRTTNNNRVLRLDAGDNIIELVSKNTISKYIIRYIKKPHPLILIDMPDNVDLTLFGGESTKSDDCELDDIVHSRIVEIAVNIALKTKSIGNNTK